jgi:hypothetical protein
MISDRVCDTRPLRTLTYPALSAYIFFAATLSEHNIVVGPILTQSPYCL